MIWRPGKNLFIGSMAFALIALAIGVLWAQVARPHFKFEAESGTNSASATNINDSTASAGQAVQFGSGSSGFDPNQTLAPGSALPSDATCASRVTPAAEIRPQMVTYNAAKGTNKGLSGTYNSRVSGNYSGTTDEILQWIACKWGLNVDMVRAQAAKESWWTMTGLGDWGTDASACPPDHQPGMDGRPGECPQSYGMMQVRYPYHGPPAGLNTWPEVTTSTAYNADYTYAVWRSCFEGELGWLNDVERGEEYRAGDAWGCIGVWFSGRWHTQVANTYISEVQDYRNTKIWTTQPFIDFR
jgi:hypothetical protein